MPWRIGIFIAFSLLLLQVVAHIERVSLSNPTMENEKRLIESILDKSIEKRQATSKIEDNDERVLFGFRGQVSVGTPGQPLSVLFDSGSNSFWVQSSLCANCSGTHFNYRASSSFILLDGEHYIRYLDGSAISSLFISETVTFNNITAKNFTMNMARQINEKDDLDGIMGFGFIGKDDLPPFVSHIFQDDPTMSQVFSYFIDKTDAAGALTIGGIDTSRFAGPLATETILPSELSSFWELSMSSLEIGESKIELPEKMTTIVDTGSSLGVFSLKMADSINGVLGIPQTSRAGWYGIPCLNGEIPSDLPDITMTLGSVKLKFTPEDYLFIKATAAKQIFCYSGFLGLSSIVENRAIMGNILLRRYYTVFDVKNRKVGFATCNREPSTNLSILESDLSAEVIGLADPASVNNETSSRSTNDAQRKHTITLFLVAILVILI